MLTIQQASKCKAQNFAVKTHDGHIADIKAIRQDTVELALYNEDGYKKVEGDDEWKWRKNVDPATLEVVPRMDGDTPCYPSY